MTGGNWLVRWIRTRLHRGVWVFPFFGTVTSMWRGRQLSRLFIHPADSWDSAAIGPAHFSAAMARCSQVGGPGSARKTPGIMRRHWPRSILPRASRGECPSSRSWSRVMMPEFRPATCKIRSLSMPWTLLVLESHREVPVDTRAWGCGSCKYPSIRGQSLWMPSHQAWPGEDHAARGSYFWSPGRTRAPTSLDSV